MLAESARPARVWCTYIRARTYPHRGRPFGAAACHTLCIIDSPHSMLKKSLITGFVALALPLSVFALENQESQLSVLFSRLQAIYQEISQLVAAQGNQSFVAAVGATQIVVGDRVQALDNLNVRQTPSTSGKKVGFALAGTLGTIIGGPTNANGYTWWQVKWDPAGSLPGATGWSVENYLQKVGGSTACTLDGITKQNGESYTFYSARTVQAPNVCSTIAQVRTCQNGSWSGNAAYQYRDCSQVAGTAPTCSITANPTAITPGQSSMLSWTSTNATGGTISGIGSVGPSGSQSVSPSQTTTYSGTFTGMGGSAECSATVTVSQNQYKFSMGDRVNATANLNVRQTPSTSGKLLKVMSAGSAGTVVAGPTNANSYVWWQVKWDAAGSLPGTTGWSVQDFLRKVSTGTDSCTTPWGATVIHGASVTAYQNPSVPNGQQCVSESRTCNNGTLSGSYQYETCSPAAPVTPSCTLSANPTVVQKGGSSTLTLASTNATSATIDQGVGAVAVNGTTNVTNIQVTKTYTATVTGAGGSAQCSATITVQTAGAPIPSGITPNNVTSQWTRSGTILLKNFVNMYNGHIIRDDSGGAYPYKMWFFGWAAHVCNNPNGAPPGTPCDSIFYARSGNGLLWEVYKGDSGGVPQFDTTMTPSLWKPVLSSGSVYYDGVHTGDPSVVKIGSDYYMVYSATGNDIDGIPVNQPGDTDQDYQGIMAAVSSDGVHWQKASRSYFASPTERGGVDNANGNMYHRPSLMYENGKFRMWFDYWTTAGGLVMGYAELPMANPTPSAFLSSTFTGINVGDYPQINAFPNPDVIKAEGLYYAYADPPQQYDAAHEDPWQARKVTEATSPDGINWTVKGYVDAEPGCAANHVPEAFYENGTIYINTGCQKGGVPYDYMYKDIRRMSKQISAPVGQSCLLDGVTVQNGQTATFYSARTVTAPNTCAAIAQSRTCTNGVLGGSPQYQYATCSVNALPVPAPTGLVASCKPSGSEVTLSWNASPGAANYGIRVIPTGSQTFHKVEDWFAGTTFTTSIVAGTNYSWWVHANPATGTLGEYTVGPAFMCGAPPPVVPPVNLKATCTDSTHVSLTWDATPGAIHYHVRIIEPDSTVFYKIVDAITTTGYSSEVVAGKAYNWWVHANFSPSELGPYTFGTQFKCGN